MIFARPKERSSVATVLDQCSNRFGTIVPDTCQLACCAVRSKSTIGQLKVLCHNVCVLIQAMHELGIEPVLAQEPGKMLSLP
jgi:hypothetical protein